jgi:hypothetical protein
VAGFLCWVPGQQRVTCNRNPPTRHTQQPETRERRHATSTHKAMLYDKARQLLPLNWSDTRQTASPCHTQGAHTQRAVHRNQVICKVVCPHTLQRTHCGVRHTRMCRQLPKRSTGWAGNKSCGPLKAATTRRDVVACTQAHPHAQGQDNTGKSWGSLRTQTIGRLSTMLAVAASHMGI